MPNMKTGLTVLSTCAAAALVTALAAGARADTADSENNALKIRRVIAVSAEGGSKVLTDGPRPVNINPKTGVGGAVLWSTAVKPQLDVGDVEPAERKPPFPPPPGETRFVSLELAPGAVVDMHATDSIDHVVLIEGEIELHLEQGPPTTLHAGDTVMMLGAQHKWVNKTNKAATAIVTAIGVAR